MDLNEQIELLKRGVVELTSEQDLRARLKKAKKDSQPLRVKLGLDPTAADVHLGFTVVLRKLR